jgi:hypothetical protein
MKSVSCIVYEFFYSCEHDKDKKRCFPRGWRYKDFFFPRFFKKNKSSFTKRNVSNTTLLVFHVSFLYFQALRFFLCERGLIFENVRENDTRKISHVAFQTLRFEKVRENDTWKTLTGHMTFGHVTSRSHIGHAQRYILYYYYCKRAENSGMRRTYFRDVTYGHAQLSDFPEIWLEPCWYTTSIVICNTHKLYILRRPS